VATQRDGERREGGREGGNEGGRTCTRAVAVKARPKRTWTKQSINSPWSDGTTILGGREGGREGLRSASFKDSHWATVRKGEGGGEKDENQVQPRKTFKKP